ncbi:hypothetical protein LMG19087_02891 [Ralstonia wenshanensis]|nr:hypothetical protein LMG19087_02891 [Ralstonia wenshanensis]
MLRKQKAATNVQARLVCAEVYRDANPVCRCFRQPAEYTAGRGYVQTSGLPTSSTRSTVPISRRCNVPM